jgi:NADPH-dependent curcumin reductase CurA
MAIDTREIHLARRPHGLPQDEDFAVVTRQLPDLEPGQVLVRNDYLSVDPYMRPRMNDVKSYIPPFELGKALDGGAIGTVIESADEDIAVGTVVSHGLGTRGLAVEVGAGD